MQRLAQTFARCRSEGRPAFVSYVCAGDPDVATSKAILASLAQAGADILEVGVPFSDPLADGLTNQLAAQRALEGGMTFNPFPTINPQPPPFTDPRSHSPWGSFRMLSTWGGSAGSRWGRAGG